MGKTVGYIRVSTDDQQAQGTPENQKEGIAKFCGDRGIEVDEWLEEAESGVNADRSEFKRLSQGIIAGLYSTVVVAAQDRLSRSPLQTFQFIENIQKAKSNLYIIREQIVIKEGHAEFACEMLIQMISVFAKHERETIRMRTMAGKERKQRSGKWVTGQAPLGYELDRQTKILRVNDVEANIVRRIFDRRIDGLGVLKIIKRLNSETPLYERRFEFKRSRYCQVAEKQRKVGYCRVRHFHEDYQGCPGCVNEYGGIEVTGTSWSPTLIKKVLKNRVYLGQIRIEDKWNPGAHDPIIDEVTFDRVHDILSQAYRHPYESYPYNLLSGLIYCACGRRMHVTTAKPPISKITGKRGKEYWAFTCPNRKTGRCNQKNIPVMLLRKKVFAAVDSIIHSKKTDEIIRKAYDRILNDRNEAKPDIEDLKGELQDVSDRLRRLSRSYTQATLAGVKEDTLREMLEKIILTEERKEILSAKIKFLESQDSAIKVRLNEMSHEELLNQVSGVWMFFFARADKACRKTYKGKRNCRTNNPSVSGAGGGEGRRSPCSDDIQSRLAGKASGRTPANSAKAPGTWKKSPKFRCWQKGHNVLMIGPPGSGKTMISQRLPTILPQPVFEEALEITKIYSAVGLLGRNGSVMTTRPFRSPHHTVSDAGLIGGGVIPRPGEVSLAHNGVLFLDELPEFRKNVLEVLRQPLEDGEVTIARAQIACTFPARFMLVAAMNPCPCGYRGDPKHTCDCSRQAIQRYWSKISGPLLDRIDIHVEVPSVQWRDLTDISDGESSKTIRERVNAARKVQLERLRAAGIFCNAQMRAALIKKHCRLDNQSMSFLERAVEKLGLSARAYHRILKIARTIADLEGSTDIQSSHVAEAIQYRTLDRRIE